MNIGINIHDRGGVNLHVAEVRYPHERDAGLSELVCRYVERSFYNSLRFPRKASETALFHQSAILGKLSREILRVNPKVRSLKSYVLQPYFAYLQPLQQFAVASLVKGG